MFRKSLPVVLAALTAASAGAGVDVAAHATAQPAAPMIQPIVRVAAGVDDLPLLTAALRDANLRHHQHVLEVMRARQAAVLARMRRRAAAARASRSRMRVALGPVAAAEAWAHSSAGLRVSNCESGGNIRAVNGQYTGKWQMDASFWSSYGGRAFASSPLGATEVQQDVVGYRGFLARGWEPWTCARITGVA